MPATVLSIMGVQTLAHNVAIGVQALEASSPPPGKVIWRSQILKTRFGKLQIWEQRGTKDLALWTPHPKEKIAS